jgi:GSH-dependent disulfide-bond oxidoreductase
MPKTASHPGKMPKSSVRDAPAQTLRASVKKPMDVYTWPTPNGHKVHILLEECGQRLGRDWLAHPINIGAGDQFKPEFLAISPNNKIPALVDHAGPDGKPVALFESGAILVYLAAKFGKFMPSTDRGKFEVLQWLMFQMGGVGPMLGQTHHFRIYAPEKIEYGINRYTNETKRLYGVMNKRLETSPFIAGKTYTIADMAIYPWLRGWQNQGIDWADYPALRAWFDKIGARPAVQRGCAVLATSRPAQMDDKAKAILFGAAQYAKR